MSDRSLNLRICSTEALIAMATEIADAIGGVRGEVLRELHQRLIDSERECAHLREIWGVNTDENTLAEWEADAKKGLELARPGTATARQAERILQLIAALRAAQKK